MDISTGRRASVKVARRDEAVNLARFRRQRTRRIILGDLVWTCHFCHRERRDEFIRTATIEASIGNVPVRHTRRYCIDRPACFDAAHFWQANADHYGRLVS
jgi:hypothetical protein